MIALFLLFTVVVILPSLALQLRPLSQRRCSSSSRLNGVVKKGPSIFDEEDYGFNDVDDEDDFKKYYPDEPTWSLMFPATNEPEMLREAPDFEKLKPDDPFFLDMSWPEEKGPEASAFARHMQWKRGLSDSERLKWQKWAVYQRIMLKDKFGYAIEDYIFQSYMNSCSKRALNAEKVGNIAQRALWSAIPKGHAAEEEIEVRAVIGSLYSAFNRKNFEELKTLWLPDESVELTLPGYDSAYGHDAVDKLYRKVTTESKPFGSVSHRVLGVDMIGYLSIATIVETVGAGSALRSVKGRPRGGSLPQQKGQESKV